MPPRQRPLLIIESFPATQGDSPVICCGVLSLRGLSNHKYPGLFTPPDNVEDFLHPTSTPEVKISNRAGLPQVNKVDLVDDMDGDKGVDQTLLLLGAFGDTSGVISVWLMAGSILPYTLSTSSNGHLTDDDGITNHKNRTIWYVHVCTYIRFVFSIV